MMNDAAEAQRAIARLETVQDGFCALSTLQPSKEGGYIQLSYQGANKFAVLQEVLVWANGAQVSYGDHASHLCDKPACVVREHVVVESPAVNNSRKNCGVIVKCPHGDCEKFISTCQHVPRCIFYVPGFESWEDLLVRGLH
jgi:hypothetical protein